MKKKGFEEARNEYFQNPSRENLKKWISKITSFEEGRIILNLIKESNNKIKIVFFKKWIEVSLPIKIQEVHNSAHMEHLSHLFEEATKKIVEEIVEEKRKELLTWIALAGSNSLRDSFLKEIEKIS